MLTDFLRDALFTTAWFGLMTCVWLGWAQEDPPKRWRGWLGAGSGVGIALALGFGAWTGFNWRTDSSLDGRYEWFGLFVLAEVVLAGVGCWLLARRGRSRWMAWWVALVVAGHFIPLAWFLSDISIAVVGVVQLALLIGLVPRLRRSTGTTSALVGAVMGASLLTYAVVNAAILLPRLF